MVRVKVTQSWDVAPQLDAMEQAYWVGCVKAAQKSCVQVREQWRDYCDVFGGGARDPERHTSAFLQRFFLFREKGAIPALPTPEHEKALPERGREDAEAHGILTAKLMRMQRFNKVREAWASHCDLLGFTRSPLDHPCSSLHTFLIHVGESVNICAQRDPYSVPAAYGPSELSNFVKKMQSKSLNWKHQWDAYCDAHGGGVRDPQRHPEAFLQGFIGIARPKPNPSNFPGGDTHIQKIPDEYQEHRHRRRHGCHQSLTALVVDQELCEKIADDNSVLIRESEFVTAAALGAVMSF